MFSEVNFGFSRESDYFIFACEFKNNTVQSAATFFVLPHYIEVICETLDLQSVVTGWEVE